MINKKHLLFLKFYEFIYQVFKNKETWSNLQTFGISEEHQMTLKRPWGLETGIYNLRNALKSNVHINELLSPTRFKGTVERTGNDGKKGSGNVSIQTFPQKHQGPMCSNSLATSLTLKTAKEYQKRAARSDPPWPQFAAPAESQTLGVYGCLIGGKTALWTAGSRLHSDLLQITAK